MHEPDDNFSSVKERAKAKLVRDMGELLMTAFNHPRTVEIMCNSDGRLWLERLGEGMRCIGTLRTAQAEAIIKTVAAYHGKEARHLKPLIEGEFPLDGSRFAGQLPPIVPGPTFAIRKRAVAVFTLQEYGVLRRNPRKFCHPKSSPAKSASRSIILPPL